MSIQPILAARLPLLASNAEVYRMVGGVASQLGSTITYSSTSSAQNRHYQNTVCPCGNYVFFWLGGSVYTLIAGTWTVVYTIASMSTGFAVSGLVPVTRAGTPTIMGAYIDGSSNVRVLYYTGRTANDPYSWRESVSIPNGYQGPLERVTVFQNKIHLIPIGSTHGAFLTIDPETLTAAHHSITNYAAARSATDFCQHNDRFFAVRGREVNSSAHYILEFTGGTWVERLALSSTLDASQRPDATAKYALMSSATDGYLYAITVMDDGVSGGSRMFRISAPAGSTSVTQDSEVTNPVLPSALRYGSAPLGQYGRRWGAFADGVTTPGSPTLDLYTSSDHNTAMTHYAWTGGAASAFTDGTAGGDASYALSEEKRASGERVYTVGTLSVEVVSVTPVLETGEARQTIRFRAYGDPSGTAGKVVQFRYSIGGLPVGVCTLTGTATGGIATRSSNTVTQVLADGATEYTITWDTTGLTSLTIGAPFVVIPEISMSL